MLPECGTERVFSCLMREVLGSSLAFTGVLLVLSAVLIFMGSIYLITYTNLGKKLAFLVTGAGLFGWTTINSLLFVVYAPRGPRQVNIEGLNAFEIRIIPLAFMFGSLILFLMFVTAMNRFEEGQERTRA